MAEEVVSMRRTFAAFLLVVALALTGCAGVVGSGAPTRSPAKSAPVLLTMPNVVGQNADVARDTLRKLGFDNIDLGTVDGRRVVILPQNWTVQTQSAKAGTHLAASAKIVLGCARIGGSRLF